MSHWSKPFADGFSTKETYKYMSLSVKLLKKYYKEINLITDYEGEKNFKDLGWASLECPLEDLNSEYQEVWSLGKLKSFNIIANKGEPFIHIDYDFYVFEDFLKKISKAQVFFQSKEDVKRLSYNVSAFKNLCPNKYLNSPNINFNDIGYNCGIIGGNNLNFFSEYSSRAMNMILDKENRDFWVGKQYDEYKNFKFFTKAVLAEQYYAQLMCQELNIEPFLFWNTTYYMPLKRVFFIQNKCIHGYGSYKRKVFMKASKFSSGFD